MPARGSCCSCRSRAPARARRHSRASRRRSAATPNRTRSSASGARSPCVRSPGRCGSTRRTAASRAFRRRRALRRRREIPRGRPSTPASSYTSGCFLLGSLRLIRRRSCGGPRMYTRSPGSPGRSKSCSPGRRNLIFAWRLFTHSSALAVVFVPAAPRSPWKLSSASSTCAVRSAAESYRRRPAWPPRRFRRAPSACASATRAASSSSGSSVQASHTSPTSTVSKIACAWRKPER